ncbi:MAG: purine-nucleoside phosphorylase [Planctomycetes bacterium]|nr:purine-nucleoside phosphorylase [Planctomycetota bacterium]NUQ35107.1 purine-nucleoside phosphorylase [Planctomycetaceae bacterium]
MSRGDEPIFKACEAIRKVAGDFRPRIGIVLGSGLGKVAALFKEHVTIPYDRIPGFPQSTVPGHSGRLMLGSLESFNGGVNAAIMQGRFHLYEGHAPQALLTPIRTLKRLGCEILILTNASGGLRPDIPPGSLMLITDHINCQPSNPLVGESGEGWGPRFPDMSHAYDEQLAGLFRASARELGIALNEGVYVSVLGPSFETPAEIRMLRSLGADIVGMSTVPEVLIARQAGMRVAAISVVTNLAAGLQRGHTLSLEEVLEGSAKASKDLTGLLGQALTKMGPGANELGGK